MIRKPATTPIPEKLDEVLGEKPKELQQLVEQAADAVPEENESALVAVPLEALPMNVALPCSVYAKIGNRFVISRRQGEKLTPKSVISLQEKGTHSLFIHKALYRIFTDSLKRLNLPEGKSQETQADSLRQLFTVYGSELEKKARESKKPVFDKLKAEAEQIAATIHADPASGLKHLRRSEDAIAYFVNHSVNSAVYAALIACKFKLPLDRLKLLTYACLVHDVGNLYIPKSILYKRDALTEEEMSQVKSHTRQGAEFLQSVGAPPLAVLVALQHHERMDGNGYPEGLSGDQIHPFSKVCAIADSFDALTSMRPNWTPVSTNEALEIMRKDAGKFDPQFLNLAEPPKVA